MNARKSKGSSIVRGAILSCLCSGLVVAAALDSPAAVAARRHTGQGQLPPNAQISGKPKSMPTGPHPSETMGKQKIKPQQL